MEDEPDRLPEFRMPTREELLQRPGMIAPIPARPIVVPRIPTNPQATLFEQPFLEPRIPTRRDLLRRRGMEMPNPLRQFYRDDEFIYLPIGCSGHGLGIDFVAFEFPLVGVVYTKHRVVL